MNLSPLHRAPRRTVFAALLAASIAACGGAVPAERAAAAPKVSSTSDVADPRLTEELARLAAATPGSLGACVMDARGTACVNGDRRYSMQSVIKLLVAYAVFDAVDRGAMRLDDPVLVRKSDLSLYVQPIADLVGPEGYRTTIGDLARRAVVDSDSAATDILLDRLGGPPAVQALLERKGLGGIRIDRNERDLQTEIKGLSWRPEFVDPAVFRRAAQAVPQARRAAAYGAYLSDARDTATPRGMAELLARLAKGELLSPASTKRLIAIMEGTRTFPTRLRAGASAGWTVAHKTGSSGSFEGRTAATNDVGLYWTPRGAPIALAVFLGESPATPAQRDEAIAAVGRLAARDR